MKTINGHNKTERVQNKLKKYFGIELKSKSNQYFEISNLKDLEDNIYVISPESVKEVKYGKLLVIDPVNNNGKVFFLNSWNAFYNQNNEYVFKLWKSEDIIRMDAIAAKDDDVVQLNKLEREVWVSKFNPFIQIRHSMYE